MLETTSLLQQEIVDAHALARELEAKVSAARRRRDAAVRRKAQVTRQHVNLTAENDSLKRMYSARIDMEGLKASEMLAGQQASLDVEIRALKDQATSAVQQCDQLRAQGAELRRKAAQELRELQESLQAQLDPLLQQVKERERQLEDQRRVNAIEIQHLQEAAEPLTEQLASLTQELEHTQADLGSKVKNADRRAADAEKSCAEQYAKAEELEHRLKTANQDVIDEKDRTIRHLEQETYRLRQELNRQMTSKDGEIAQLHAEVLEYVDYIVRVVPDSVGPVKQELRGWADGSRTPSLQGSRAASPAPQSVSLPKVTPRSGGGLTSRSRPGRHRFRSPGAAMDYPRSTSVVRSARGRGRRASPLPLPGQTHVPRAIVLNR
mmetsp:Transcript_4175/g.9247  ORF Transcript_4175/g.9247 Transcript_4175/m.9247 type:complete len:379 (+) Transcript_4175:44-1180(+)